MTSHLLLTVAELLALAENAAGELLGTCRSLHDLGEEIEDASASSTFAAHLDSLAVECVACSWWVPPDEMTDTAAGEFVCAECENSSK